MIPMGMRIYVKEKGKQKVNLWLPIFIAWILLLALSLVLLPFILIFGILLWPTGYGKIILSFLPYIWGVLWAMSGLKIDISKPDEEFYFVFN